MSVAKDKTALLIMGQTKSSLLELGKLEGERCSE